MKNVHKFLLKGGLVASFSLCFGGPAFALGLTDPLLFQGNGSRVIDTGTASASLPVTVVAEDITNISNSTSTVNYSGSGLTAWATTTDYGFSGSISSSGYAKAWRSGGYFKDELSFGSSISGTYSIDFVFDVNANAELYDISGRTDLTMTMSYWNGSSYSSVDTQYLLSHTGDPAQTILTGAYELSLTGIDYTNLVVSQDKIYLPYTIGLWGDAVNGSISWNDVILADVIIKDELGSILTPDLYNLESGSTAFNSATSDVPLPSAVFFLGAGFASVAGLRRRK